MIMMKFYTVKKLAEAAGVSVRTLHYYDEIGLLKPKYRAGNGYRQYDEAGAARLQQIMFFRELDFSLEDIKRIMAQPDFDMVQALESHRALLGKRKERLDELLATVDRTIKKYKGETEMTINDYYKGFSEEEIERYRREAREKYGEAVVKESEERVMKMGKEKFEALQAQGGEIFKTIADNMDKGYDSQVVQEQVKKWREWLENFSHYSDDAVLGLGKTYSKDPEFAKFFRKIHKDLPEFLSKAVERWGGENRGN